MDRYPKHIYSSKLITALLVLAIYFLKMPLFYQQWGCQPWLRSLSLNTPCQSHRLNKLMAEPDFKIAQQLEAEMANMMPQTEGLAQRHFNMHAATPTTPVTTNVQTQKNAGLMGWVSQTYTKKQSRFFTLQYFWKTVKILLCNAFRKKYIEKKHIRNSVCHRHPEAPATPSATLVQVHPGIPQGVPSPLGAHNHDPYPQGTGWTSGVLNGIMVVKWWDPFHDF